MLDSLANVKTRLGISSMTEDTFLTAQITMLSDTIEAYCRRRFLSATYEQTFYSCDYPIPSIYLELFNYPVVSITSILEDGVAVASDAYRLNKPTGKLTRTSGVFLLAQKTVIRYQSGLTNCPTPVLDVLDSLVRERYNKKISGINLDFGSDVQRITIPGAISIDFDYTLNNNERSSAFGVILGNSINVLDFYRSERAVVGDGKLIYIEDV